MTVYFGKELFIRFTASAFRKLLSVYVFSYFPFGLEGRMWDLIVSVPDHCLSFYFSIANACLPRDQVPKMFRVHYEIVPNVLVHMDYQSYSKERNCFVPDAFRLWKVQWSVRVSVSLIKVICTGTWSDVYFKKKTLRARKRGQKYVKSVPADHQGNVLARELTREWSLYAMNKIIIIH